MQLAPRPIAALAVVGVLSLLSAGCSAGGDDPTPTPSHSSTRTSGATPSGSASSTASAGPTQAATAPSAGSDQGSDDVPTAFPGTGQTVEPDADPAGFPATALVTFAGWDTGTRTLQAGGLVSGTTDTSGTCRFTAKKGAVTRTLTSEAAASASSVNCAQVSFPSSQVTTGTWSITLTYTVGSKSTSSEPMTAEVP